MRGSRNLAREAFSVGFLVKLQCSLITKGFHVLITFHMHERFGIQPGYPLWGPCDDICDMQRTLGKGDQPRRPMFGPGGNMHVINQQRMIKVELGINF
jgi:hypothetical protein